MDGHPLFVDVQIPFSSRPPPSEDSSKLAIGGVHLETHALTRSTTVGLPGKCRLGPVNSIQRISKILTRPARTKDDFESCWLGPENLLVLDGSGSLSQRALLPRKTGNRPPPSRWKGSRTEEAVPGGECVWGSGEDFEHSQRFLRKWRNGAARIERTPRGPAEAATSTLGFSAASWQSTTLLVRTQSAEMPNRLQTNSKVGGGRPERARHLSSPLRRQ